MRAADQGVILINVLVVLALTSAVLLLMVRASDVSLARAQVFSDAAQGLALIRGSEASAIASLRSDMIEAPDTDHLQEDWTRVAQARIGIDTGTFAVTITDAQSRLNLNSLRNAGVAGQQILARLAARLKLPEDTAPRILARLHGATPLVALDRLGPEAGIAPETLASLRPVLTLLPGRRDINVNTAPADLIFALTDNPVQARILLALRDRKGFLTAADFAAASVILPAGTGFASQYFEIVTEVTVGGTSQSQRSLLRRYTDDAGNPEVAVIARGSGS